MSKALYFGGGLIFGSVIGFFSTKFLIQEKYRQKSDEDVSSVKNTYGKTIDDLKKTIEELKNGSSPEDTQEKRAEPVAAAKLNASKAKEKPTIRNYVNYATSNDQQESKRSGRYSWHEKGGTSAPFVISPDEFGSKDGYEEISLTWYADQVLADDSDHRLDEDEVEIKVGADFMNHFGEYEDDSVFVRNNEMRCDYEILMDRRKFSDVLQDKPYLKD